LCFAENGLSVQKNFLFGSRQKEYLYRFKLRQRLFWKKDTKTIFTTDYRHCEVKKLPEDGGSAL
jgi:hypothetical protein